MGMINNIIQSQYNPLRVDGVDMKGNLLLMCKLLFFLLVLHRFHYYIDDPYLPFIPFFEHLRGENYIFKIVLQGVFYASGFFLIFNYRVRLMAIALGLVIILSLLASKPVFANHKFFCGCLFLLAGLSNKKGAPWLIFIQMSIMYFGAALNKVLQTDWWNGVYMENWMVNVIESNAFIVLSDLFPDLFISKILSLGAIFIEFLLAILILFRKKHTLVVYIMLFFHTALYTITSLRFGHFYENMVIVLLAFLKWPEEPIIIYVSSMSNKWFIKLLAVFDNMSYLKIGTLVKERSSIQTIWFKIKVKNKIKYNFYALKDFLLYTPLFYLLLFTLDIFVRILFDGRLVYFTQITLVWIVIMFFSIISLSEFKTYVNKFKLH